MWAMNDLERRVDDVLATALAEERIVGAIFLVRRAGKRVYGRAVGLADREGGRPMTVTTPHRLASLTKPVTAVAALALADRGRLSTDDPVTRWLPDFRPRLGAAAPPITIQQLLTHTSGLGYTFNEPPGGPYHQARVSDGLEQPGLGIAENLRRLASVPLRFAPGSAFEYSLSFDVLGAVLERAADAPLDQAIERYVTGPLGLGALSFSATSGDGLAVPYADGKPPQRIRAGVPVPVDAQVAVTFAPERAFDATSYPSGGAGMVGTADAFLGFLEAVRTRAVPTVSAARLDTMLRDQIPALTAERLGPGWGYGYGVSVLRDPQAAESPLSRAAVRWGGAYGHSWWIDPASHTAAVLLTNTAFEGMIGALRSELERAVHA